ncbi:hypothetical protein PV10_02733 [Exophiala mesophila]|uniref:Sphingoid long-chain base transporter RSB1 n=1 Tax=Exophiala mesophila TaxID=212818 RepID=A0A0D1Y393_EXOME|nr:uncharacterized protein PV10_02733 [Exophiala mesophila]KIV95026.1 hypothetical protein PV10_02733 [Exophiala mesophila]
MSDATERLGNSDYRDCTSVSPQCPVEGTLYGDYFNEPANIFFAIVFGLATVTQLWLGIKTKTWSFTAWIMCGVIFECVGYVGRVLLSKNPWDDNAQRIQLVCLILGPTFIAAAISVTFKHIFIYAGRQYSIVRPKWVPYIFIGTDLFAILVQVVGGVVAATAIGNSSNTTIFDVATAILTTGVAFQAANMVFCGGFVVIFFRRYQRAKKHKTEIPGEETTYHRAKSAAAGDPAARREVRNFRVFTWTLALAYIAIIVRCIYRIPEMASGWGSELMQDEVTFLTLDGMMIALAILCLTFVHPGVFFPFMRKTHSADQNTSSGEASTPSKSEKFWRRKQRQEPAAEES